VQNMRCDCAMPKERTFEGYDAWYQIVN